MDVDRKIASYHAKIERRHAARHARGKAGLAGQAARWELKWQRRAARFATKVAKLPSVLPELAEKAAEAAAEKAAEIAEETGLVKKEKRKARTPEKPRKKVREVKFKPEKVREVKAKPAPESKLKEIIRAVEAAPRPWKKAVKEKKEPAVPAAVPKESLPKPEPAAEPAKEEPGAGKRREQEPVETTAQEPVETTVIAGPFTEVSMPKIKEEKEHDWSAKRFRELEEKLKKLRRM